ncbi:hypothetical protein T439DRAFT_351298 [Meredithblackwellia eburnea MCA 4105]
MPVFSPRPIRRLDANDTIPDATSQISQAILGPVMLGDCFQLILFGVSLALYSSYITSSRPSQFARLITTTVILLSCLITGLYINDIWFFSTLQQRTEDDLLTGTFVETLEPLFVGVVGALVQGVLIRRTAFMFSRNSRKYAFIICLALMVAISFVASLGTTIWGVAFFKDPFLDSATTPTFNQCVAIWLGASALVDTAITTTLLFHLWASMKGFTGFSASADSALTMVTRFVLQSAAYTTAMAIPGALLSIIFNGDSLLTTDIAYAFFLPLPGLYTLSLFTTLTLPSRVEAHFKASGSRSGSHSDTYPPAPRIGGFPKPPPLSRQSASISRNRGVLEEGTVDGIRVHVELERRLEHPRSDSEELGLEKEKERVKVRSERDWEDNV